MQLLRAGRIIHSRSLSCLWNIYMENVYARIVLYDARGAGVSRVLWLIFPDFSFQRSIYIFVFSRKRESVTNAFVFLNTQNRKRFRPEVIFTRFPSEQTGVCGRQTPSFEFPRFSLKVCTCTINTYTLLVCTCTIKNSKILCNLKNSLYSEKINFYGSYYYIFVFIFLKGVFFLQYYLKTQKSRLERAHDRQRTSVRVRVHVKVPVRELS